MKTIILRYFVAFYFIYCKSLLKKSRIKQNTVEVIPDEIEFPNPVLHAPSKYLYNIDKFNYNLEKNRITLEENSKAHNGKLYYRNPFPYYGPQTTYHSIPSMEEDVKFITPVQIKNIEFYSGSNSLIEELDECERQLTHLLLFEDEPKNTGKFSINDNYALPYYDTTGDDTILKIEHLRDRILEIRRFLKIKDPLKVELFVNVKNSTFPHRIKDIADHLKDTSTTTYTPKTSQEYARAINGNLTSSDQLYDLRQKKFNEHALSMKNLDHMTHLNVHSNTSPHQIHPTEHSHQVGTHGFQHTVSHSPEHQHNNHNAYDSSPSMQIHTANNPSMSHHSNLSHSSPNRKSQQETNEHENEEDLLEEIVSMKDENELDDELF